MKLLKSAGLALALSVLGTAALAADAMDCCCKDKDGKMSCCDKTQGEPEPAPPTPAPDQGQPEARRPPQ